MTRQTNFLSGIVHKQFGRVIADAVGKGTLVVEAPDGHRHRGGDSSGKPIHVRVEDWRTVVRLMLNPDLYLGEAYVSRSLTVVEGTIYDLLDLIFRNATVKSAPGMSRYARAAYHLLGRLKKYNSPLRSKKNVARHYDLDGRLFDLFLDSDKQYSCGYFEDSQTSLEDAQVAKKRHLAAKLALKPGMKVLDIGSGWGGLCLYFAKHFDVDVRGVTLSDEQLIVSRERAALDNLQGSVQFDLKDFRALRTRFDRIVSVGMFEHVGLRGYSEFFKVINSLLNDEGVAVLHFIGRTTRPFETNAWISKYIFPGGYLPSLSQVLPSIEASGLSVSDVEVLRLHYAETLAEWRSRFISNKVAAEIIYDDRFVRMWEFYLAASEAAFRHGGLVVYQIQLLKDQEALPLVRDYIIEEEQRLKNLDAAVRPGTSYSKSENSRQER